MKDGHSTKARETSLEAAAEAEAFRDEEAKVRAELADDPFVSNEDFGRQIEEAADSDERRSWEAERADDGERLMDVLKVTVRDNATGQFLTEHYVEVLDEPVKAGRNARVFVSPVDLFGAQQAIVEAARLTMRARGVAV